MDRGAGETNGIPCFHDSWTGWLVGGEMVPLAVHQRFGRSSLQSWFRMDGHKVVRLGLVPGGKGIRAAGGGDVSHSAIW